MYWTKRLNLLLRLHYSLQQSMNWESSYLFVILYETQGQLWHIFIFHPITRQEFETTGLPETWVVSEALSTLGCVRGEVGPFQLEAYFSLFSYQTLLFFMKTSLICQKNVTCKIVWTRHDAKRHEKEIF